MLQLSFLIWTADPEMFTLPFSWIGLEDRPVRWYGVLFALGFVLSQQIMFYIYKREGKPISDIEQLTTYMIVATILGARLGHCLFYNPGYYLSNPLEILKVWEGGLASHGGAIGILTAIWLYIKYDIRVKWMVIIPVKFSVSRVQRKDQNFLQVVDRLVIVVALTGALIRIGNFMNSEMEGTETNSSYGIVYARATHDVLFYDEENIESVDIVASNSIEGKVGGRTPLEAVITYKRGFVVDAAELQFIQGRLANALRSYPEVIQHIDFGSGALNLSQKTKEGKSQIILAGEGINRHPAQLYEAFYCLLLMALLFILWQKKSSNLPIGFNFALFNILLWSLRFIDEFFKMNQEAFEDNMSLNMGQWLSIPMALMGVVVMIYIFQKKNK